MCERENERERLSEQVWLEIKRGGRTLRDQRECCADEQERESERAGERGRESERVNAWEKKICMVRDGA